MKAALYVIALLGSPILHAADVAGHYTLHMREAASELVLKPGGTFEFQFAYGAADYTGEGTWKSDNQWVILNSETKDEPPFRLTRGVAGRQPGFQVHILAPNGRPVENILVGLRTPEGELEEHTSPEGIASFPPRKGAASVLLRIPEYSLEAGPFEITTEKNELTFEINPPAITQVHFHQEHLAIEGKDLLLRYFSKTEPMRYVHD